jgi:purine-nucleoside phosphorylase
MATPHIESNNGDIAKIVLMPGDPKRAKLIADNYLDNVKLVNEVRGMTAYTGTYKGKLITVFPSGMGMPSMGIYSYELFNKYDVDYIIRIGTCGAYSSDINILDTILVDKAYTEGNFALTMNNDNCHYIRGSYEVNDLILETAKEINLNILKCNDNCTECFDYYITDLSKMFERLPKEYNLQVAEMEAFSLFYTAKVLKKKAATLLTVVDSHAKHQEVDAETREKNVNDMIVLALETVLKIK